MGRARHAELASVCVVPRVSYHILCFGLRYKTQCWTTISHTRNTTAGVAAAHTMGPVLSSANADLCRLAETIVATIANVRAATTLTSYSSQLRMFWLWADEHHISRSYPVAVPIVTAYLQHRTETAGCAGIVR